MSFTMAVVGGCGHVGLPLGLAFASRGVHVTLIDKSEERVAQVAAGRMPFWIAGRMNCCPRCWRPDVCT